VRAWEEAAQLAHILADSVSNGPHTIQASPAITTLVWDAAERADEALHRARRRAGNPEMRSTVFGRVLAELLEKREIPVTPFRVGKLAEEAGLDGWKVINRMADADAEDVGSFDGLAQILGLSDAEKDELAFAYVFERRTPHAAEPSKEAQTIPGAGMEARKRAVAALAPEQRERGRRLLVRSDALSHALVAVLSEGWPIEERKAETLKALTELRDEASAEFRRFREEVGIGGL
jgi:hypothetical protein